MSAQGPVILFDGLCPLCNAVVRGLVRADRRGRLRFAPLGGETAGALLAGDPRMAAIDSIVFTDADDARRLVRTAAVIAALVAVGGPWRFAAALLWFVPRPLRDLGYDFIAARRRRRFGVLNACPPPPPGLRDRFLP